MTNDVCSAEECGAICVSHILRQCEKVCTLRVKIVCVFCRLGDSSAVEWALFHPPVHQDESTFSHHKDNKTPHTDCPWAW